MKQQVSKARAKKAKSREKRSGVTASVRAPIAHNPLVGFLIVLVLWASSVLLIHLEGVLGLWPDPAFVLPLAGDAAFLFLCLLSAGLFLELVKPSLIHYNKNVASLALAALLSLLPAKLLLSTMQGTALLDPRVTMFLLPFVMAPMLATILYDSTVGLAAGVWVATAMATMAGRDFSLLLTGLIVTVLTAWTSRAVRTRSKAARCGLVVGVAEIACVFCLTVFNWQAAEPMLVLYQAAACVAGGFLSAILVLLIVPVFEALFGMTTDITLLELSDLGHPLLQRLAIEAPGTYHHSLVVANLAQAAADEIGANGLLSRVSAYFHDIGKLTKPDFFSENIHLQNNPHDDLPPSMSTLIITSHVKEGQSLAQLHKLPAPVMRAIAEHHGTSLVSYFHHKAKSMHDGEQGGQSGSNGSAGNALVDEGNFRYPGPPPTTRESAVLCLADAVEAASRSMVKTTPGHIENLVDDIVTARIQDGQLDRCALTMAELTMIRRSFVFSLTSMLHGRVAYPKDESRDRQQAKPASGSAEGPEARSSLHAAGRQA